MSESRWKDVDEYLAEHLLPPDPVLEETLRKSEEGGLPAIQVAPVQGKFLMLLAQLCGAKRILEIGTLGGYSTTWLARALPPDGQLITLEANPQCAEIARDNLARAGFSGLVEIREGLALESLPDLAGGPPFDMVFIDADKPNNPNYFEWSLRLSRPGTLIVADNIVRDGRVTDAESEDASVIGTRQLIEMIGLDQRVDATAVQTVGQKGYDGFALIRVRS